jgi:hypothetical protein
MDGSIFPSSYDYYCYFSVQAILNRLHLFPSFHSRFPTPITSLTPCPPKPRKLLDSK